VCGQRVQAERIHKRLQHNSLPTVSTPFFLTPLPTNAVPEHWNTLARETTIKQMTGHIVASHLRGEILFRNTI